MKDWSPKLWLRILLPTVLIVAWLAIAGVGGPTFGKISSVSTNDQAGFLPASADSTAVNEWQTKFYDSKSIPAVIVSVSDSGKISDADKAKFVALSPKIAKSPGVADLPAQAFLPTFSEDGQAVEYFVPFTASGEELTGDVNSLRTLVKDEFPTGYKSYVTGPAGLLADFVKGFAGIDGILLIVALLAVFVILLVVYRSILLPILVLLTSVFALSASIVGIYYLALNDIIKVSGQSQGILSILVIGAATDYALLFVSRYREALFEVQSKWAAIGRAYRGSFEAIAFSAATVILALLCLLFSDLNSNKALGPIAAFGIFFAFLAAVSFLPALLAVFGRGAFWPFMPKFGKKKVEAADAEKIAGLEGIRGLWRRVGTLISKRPRATWVITLIVLLAAVAALPTLKANGLPQTDLLLGSNIEAVDGQKALGEHFDAGSGSPVVIIANESNYTSVEKLTKDTAGVSAVTVFPDSEKTKAAYEEAMKKAVATSIATHQPLVVPTVAPVPKVVDGKVLIDATLKYQADSADAENVVKTLRTEFKDADNGALVGGTTAIALDTNATAQADLVKIIPIVLVVIFIILMLLLRSIVAPLILIGTVVVSYAATLGVSALVFNNVFKFPGADASVPLFGFVFLVALGIDYNIFLMTRVREESINIGTRPGILRGLAVTGGVITSAGVVLAATFAALGVIPILFLAQLAFIVSFGVILDTVIVRSLLVPALSYDIGKKIWWPSKLAKLDK
jgi:RND superfamily putative drug exporter